MIARAVLLAVLALFWLTLLIRVNGLRSLSKMTNFDFVMTIAIGSLLAGAAQASDWSGLVQALLAMAALFAAQWITARLRKDHDRFEDAIQNKPLMLMRNGEFLRDEMKDARVSESDLVAKLREANVLDMAQVRAVVLETTGDVSVLHGDRLDECILDGVRTPDE